MANTIQDAMASAGLQPHKPLELIADGKVKRFRLTGEKSGKASGWLVAHAGPPLFVIFGSWKVDGHHTWSEATAKPITPAERADIQRRTQAMRQAHALERESVQTDARAKAKKLWGRGHWATNNHPYAERKRINVYGLKQLRDMLLVPARDINGTMHTLQFIMPDGTKRFLTGGRIAGCYFAIGKPVDRLLLCEGLATASSLRMATDAAVAVCFSAGNLLAVARALRGKFPRLKLVLCADNDVNTPGNPGLTKAREAAKAVGGYLAVPAINHGAQPCPF